MRRAVSNPCRRPTGGAARSVAFFLFKEDFVFPPPDTPCFHSQSLVSSFLKLVLPSQCRTEWSPWPEPVVPPSPTGGGAESPTLWPPLLPLAFSDSSRRTASFKPRQNDQHTHSAHLPEELGFRVPISIAIASGPGRRMFPSSLSSSWPRCLRRPPRPADSARHSGWFSRPGPYRWSSAAGSCCGRAEDAVCR